jgi:hypothetical protein
MRHLASQTSILLNTLNPKLTWMRDLAPIGRAVVSGIVGRKGGFLSISATPCILKQSMKVKRFSGHAERQLQHHMKFLLGLQVDSDAVVDCGGRGKSHQNDISKRYPIVRMNSGENLKHSDPKCVDVAFCICRSFRPGQRMIHESVNIPNAGQQMIHESVNIPNASRKCQHPE